MLKVKNDASLNKDIIYKFYSESTVIYILDVAVILHAFKFCDLETSICEFIEKVSSNVNSRKNFELDEFFEVIL